MYVLEDRIFRIDMQWFKLFNTETMFKIDLQDQGEPKPSSSSLVRLRSAVLWSWKRSPWPCNRTRVGQIDTYSSPSHRSNICIPTIFDAYAPASFLFPAALLGDEPPILAAHPQPRAICDDGPWTISPGARLVEPQKVRKERKATM